MASPNSRKRAAPGASPPVPVHQPFQATTAEPTPFVRWNAGDNAGFLDDSPGINSLMQPIAQTPHALSGTLAPTMPATPSTALARRQLNRAPLIASPRPHFEWAGHGLATPGAANMEQTPVSGEVNEEETMAQLEARALKAKREAEAKRKQIPPFVQKLASFLEQGKNQDLIRWSEKGDSFIVVNEDEFAKKLIPELFKHNNYASFVRQLNMYGFHKRVGLSDNSMRASERKGKSPSEYENKYFIRGHPNLLWLITKPKNNSKKKGAKPPEGDEDSDDDLAGDDSLAQGGYGAPQSSRALPPTDLGALPTKKELAFFRDEFRKIRDQQSHILQRIQGLEQNQQAVQKELLAQQHANRRVDDIYKMYAHHEQLMKQMMQVLVYHFKKSVDLDDPATAQQLKDIMQAGFLPPGHHNSSGVFELSDEIGQMPGQASSPLGALRRTRGLLEAPPVSLAGNVDTTTASAPAFAHATSVAPETGVVTEIFDPSPAEQAPPPFSLNTDDELMNILQGTGVPSSTAPTIPNVTSSAMPTTAATATATADLSQHLPQMANSSPTAGRSRPTSSGMPSSLPASVPSTMPYASASSIPSSVPPVTTAASAPLPVSPPMPSIPPNMSNDDIEELRRLQEQTGGMINSIGHIIAPLSPSGRLPGITDNVEPDGYFPATTLPSPTDYDDFNQFLNMEPADPNFLFDAGQDLTSTATGTGNTVPSPTGTDDLPRDEAVTDSPTRSAKRRKI